MSKNQNETIIIDADEEVSTPRLMKFKNRINAIHPVKAILTTAVVVGGICGASYIYSEYKNPRFMDEATELRLIDEGKI